MLPPNIIPAILAFYFLNGHYEDKYCCNHEYVNFSQRNNFNLIVMLILIIVYYSDSNSAYRSVYPDPQTNSNQSQQNNNVNYNVVSNIQSTIQSIPIINGSKKDKTFKNSLNTSNRDEQNNYYIPKQSMTKHNGQQEEFTYAKKEVKSDNSGSLLSKFINNDYQGATVTALISNGTTVTGEVVFTFKDIVSLKTQDSIIFVNSKDIVSFF